MTLEEAREILGLPVKASRREIRAAYRRAARRWHPDRAPGGQEAQFRSRMQEINAAHQVVLKFLEDYRYDLVAPPGPEDVQKWYTDRFYTGVWQPPPGKRRGKKP